MSLPNGFEPRPYQTRLMRYLDNGGKRAVCVWHRRAGKDLTALHQMAKMAHERTGIYWHMLPAATQARKAVWNGFTSDGKRLVDSVFPPAIVKRKNETEMLLELRCGSMIQLVGSDNYDRLVGSNPIGVTFSEFALNKPSAWDYIRPILAVNQGWAAFISTPRGKNHLWRLYDHGRRNPEWFAEAQTIHDTGVLDASILDEERAAGMPEALVRQEYLVDFTAALVGSVWGDLIEAAEKDGRLEAFEHERDGIFTSWDLGISDSTSIWFWRVTEQGADFVDHYEAHGKPLSHFFDILEEKATTQGYRYVKHWLPHDARARTLATGSSILDQCLARLGSDVAIGPALSLLDGIQAGRWLLERSRGVRFHARCGEGLEALRQYHYEYDTDRKTFTSRPEHDWSSHAADAFRYAACVVRTSELLTRKPESKPKPPPARSPDSFALDELWDTGPRQGTRRI